MVFVGVLLLSQNNQRLRLYGKLVTKQEIALEVLKLKNGDPKRDVPPMSISKIAQKLSFDSRQTVYNYLEYAKNENIVTEKELENQKYKRPSTAEEWKRFSEKHPITQDILVSDWLKDMQRRNGGEGLVIAKDLVTCLQNILNTLKINPVDLLQSKEQTEKLGWNFIDLVKEGKIDSIKKSLDPKKISMPVLRYRYAKATRDFMSFHNFSFRKGETGWFAQKIIGHGKYADIRLTSAEFEEATRYLIEKYGKDSDEFRFFWVGVESCARITALVTMNLTYEVAKNPVDENEKCYVMKVFESKTKKIRGGIWTKYITRKDTQESIDALRKRSGSKIYERKGSLFSVKDYFRDAMIDLFHHLGKIPNLEELQQKRKEGWANTGNYWFDHAGHVLRHIGAHYWLAKGHYTNHVFVALIGGWNTVDELIKSYGSMPPEMVLRGVFNIKEVAVA